jgi:CubicO group peptidase (beta-lactamase class C family)
MLVASKDKVLGLEAVGWSDTAARKPMATDALFWIASQSKPMTAAAFMMLVNPCAGMPRSSWPCCRRPTS